MPTMTLALDAVGASTAGHWDANTGTQVTAVASDDGSTTYIGETTNSEKIMYTVANPSVASGDVASITSVQVKTVGRFPARGSGGSNVTFEFQNFPSDVGAESLNYPNSASFVSRDGTAQTTDSNGAAIDYSDVEGLQLEIKKNGTTSEVWLTYVAIEVVYVAAVTATDNSIFFGANF